LAQCEAAQNREIYDAPWGKAIRFKAGMEPGIAAYNKTIYGDSTARSTLAARADGGHANLEMGQNQMNYVAINPYDVIATLWTPCQYSSCDPHPYQAGTACVVDENDGGCWGTKKPSANIDIHVDGQYDGWDKQSALMTAILKMCQQNQGWTEKSWEQWQWVSDNSGGHGVIVSSGSQCEGTQVDYYNVNHYTPSGDLQDHMIVWLDLEVGDKSGSWMRRSCQRG
jgi:hypothetical protein